MRYAADTIHKISDKREYININLEQFHRSAAAIYPDSTIFAVPEKGEQAIIFTTINPDSWDDVWKNKIGAYHGFLQFTLKSHKSLNLLAN